MKNIIYVFILLVSLVLITSCNIGPTDQVPIPDEVKEVLEGEPQKETTTNETKEESNRIDEMLNKTFTAKTASLISLEDISVYSFIITKNESEDHILKIVESSYSLFLVYRDGKYYCNNFELVIDEELKTITIDGRVYGTTE